MEMLMEQGSGITLYLHQEGRGIGLIKKLKTSTLQTAKETLWGSAEGRTSGTAARGAVSASEPGPPRRPLNRTDGQLSRHEALKTWIRPGDSRSDARADLNHRGLPQLLQDPLRAGGACRRASAAKVPDMELLAYQQGSHYFSSAMADSRQYSGSESSCDSRHRSITSQLNTLIDTVRHRPDCNPTAEAERLLDAMLDHFGYENNCMMQVGFPQAVVHGLRHQAICFNTAKVSHRLRKGQEVAPHEVAFIRLLWLEHIQVHDRAFEEFLAS
ncbi:hypothetical protein AOG2_04780 [Geobacter sp. AOG2]|nr:hypothetical protein AOG2_04780 [Geobacter sp. AOG2]